MSDEQGRVPTRVTKWDYLSLLSDLTSEIFVTFGAAFDTLTRMLEHQASFVDDKENFHEYAARTIETLQEGE
jgi:hypothetical protein